MKGISLLVGNWRFMKFGSFLYNIGSYHLNFMRFRGWFSRNICKRPLFHPLIDVYIYDIYIYTNRIYTDTQIPIHVPALLSILSMPPISSNYLASGGRWHPESLLCRRWGWCSIADIADAIGEIVKRRELHRPYLYHEKGRGNVYLAKKPYWLEELAAASPKHHHLTRSMAK